MTEYVEPATEALSFWTKLTYNVGEVKGSLSNFYDMNGYIISGVLLVGGYTIAKHLLSNTYSFYKTFIRPARNLYKRYHGGSVVITGATDGLGLEYANQFAAMDLASCSSPETKVSVRPQNLIFVEKLDQVKLGLMGKYKTIEVETITFDFDIPYTEEGYRPLKESLDKVKDISVLVNNVGNLENGLFKDIDIKSLNTMIQVNCVPQMAMIKFLLPRLLDRSNNESKK